MQEWRTLDAIARAILEEDTGELVELTRGLLELPLSECEHCDELTHHDDTHGVHTDGMGCQESWCESCVECYATYWNSDGEYHDSPECTEDYPDYHSADKRPGFDNACGLEVELEFFQPPDEVIAAADAADVLLEQDSSLSESNSAEAITHPFRLDRDGLAKLGGLTQFLANVKCGGFGRLHYGIHVNLNRGNYTRFDVGRAMRFLATHSDEVARVCGRASVYDGRGGRAIADCYPASSSIRDNRLGVKYATVNLCHRRIEFRIFQSNAKPDAIRRYVKFARDVMEFGRIGGHNSTWTQFTQAYQEWSTVLQPTI